MPYPSLYEVPAYQKAKSWIIEDVRKAARRLSGAPVWMPTPQPGEELDGILWIRQFLEHDKQGIRTEQHEEEPDYKAMIIEVLADGGEYTTRQIAKRIDLDTKRVSVLLSAMRDGNRIEDGGGLVRHGKLLHTWRAYVEREEPTLPLEKFLLGCNAETNEAVSLLQRIGPMTVSDLAERIGISMPSVYRRLRPLKDAGYLLRKRFHRHAGAYMFYLFGDEDGNRDQNKARDEQVHGDRGSERRADYR